MDKQMKLLMFFVRKISGVVILGLIIMLTTFTAFDLANVYVILNDGMSQRAYTILSRQDPAELNKYFTLSYISYEPLFYNNQYMDFVIEDYEYELKIEKMWIWPWQKHVKITVNENIPDNSWVFTLVQQASNSPDDEQNMEGDNEKNDEQGANPIPPPWNNGKKIVEFRKIDGQWKIDNVSELN